MTDIFLSYSSRDRDRVGPIRDALAAQGFDVFWDQSVPTGVDWDTWIRRHLAVAKCAVVVWSVNSIASDNVRHEATVAKQHGKLVPVMLDSLAADQLPMGLYTVQFANLSSWTGDAKDAEWVKFLQVVEAKLTPLWVRKMMDELDAQLVAERARREVAERRDKTLRDQITKEAQSHQEFRSEHERVLDEISDLQSRLATMTVHQAGLKGEVSDLSQRLRDEEEIRKKLMEKNEEADRTTDMLKQGMSERENQPEPQLKRRRAASWVTVPIKVGDRIPDGKFRVMTAEGPGWKSTDEVFIGKKVVLFGVPGAFTPTCYKQHLPGFLRYGDAFKAKGVDTIAVTAVNDVFVMTEWKKASGAEGKIEFLADGNGDFARALDLTMDGSAGGLGLRSRRYSMLVENGVVKQLNIEDAPGKAETSSAETLLKQL
jgi:peroxiredoxin